MTFTEISDLVTPVINNDGQDLQNKVDVLVLLSAFALPGPERFRIGLVNALRNQFTMFEHCDLDRALEHVDDFLGLERVYEARRKTFTAYCTRVSAELRVQQELLMQPENP